MPQRKDADAVACPPVVAQLVRRFDQHKETYKRQAYNETQVRREFIDPLFEALGWDVDNKAGHAEAYKDVIHEDAIKVGGATKAPDYCFRIGGVRKFFVEAKRPSVAVKDEAGPAWQVRRYAWNVKLPLAIVTDFEEFAVYDCRIKPKPTDKPATARVMYVTYDEYPTRWGEVASIFGKEAILNGSFDRYAESTRRKRGTAEVDTEFLKDIETWRELLARNIALRNRDLSQRDMNYAVSKTIDRIIFLRMSEDRGIETYEQLRALLNGPSIYKRLIEVFYRADERYNSGLFYFRAEKGRPDAPDDLTPGLIVDDRVLKDIIKGLYYPCPYDFSALPPEILGQVYEQFLGKVIRLTRGHRAVVEEKPEVKKAGGVYYTPGYIVDYIVRHTVGKLLGGRTVKWIAREKRKTVNRPRLDQPLRVLDPACGSGSFLLGAYECLLRWYLGYYTNNDLEGWAKRPNPPIYERHTPHSAFRTPRSSWRLTIAERKRILLDHLFGVDIDPQAVEVTKLSLLLKVLEGESQQTLDNQLRLFHERALPDLAGNIKCGNSLIGPDFYDNQQMTLLDEEERYRINVFDWHAEFPEIMGPRPGPRSRTPDPRWGFDAVIGNPPYGALFSDSEAQYLQGRSTCFAAYADSYVAFLETGLGRLCNDGLLGMIIPSAVFGGPAYVGVRSYLLTSAAWTRAVLLPYDVFTGAYIDTCVVCMRRCSQLPESHQVLTFEFPKRAKLTDMADLSYRRVTQATWTRDREQRIMLDPFAAELIPRLLRRCAGTLSDSIEIKRGVLPGPESLSERRTEKHRYRYFEGSVYRYILEERFDRYIAFDDSLRERPRELNWFTGDRILLRRLVSRRFRLMATLAQDEFITNKNLYSILTRGYLPIEVILGILNSSLVSFLYVKQVTQAAKDDFAQVTIKDIRALPCPRRVDADIESELPSRVSAMLDLHKQLSAAKTPVDKTAIQRQIEATDRQIDELVYELYGLSDEEIRIVEEATGK